MESSEQSRAKTVMLEDEAKCLEGLMNLMKMLKTNAKVFIFIFALMKVDFGLAVTMDECSQIQSHYQDEYSLCVQMASLAGHNVDCIECVVSGQNESRPGLDALSILAGPLSFLGATWLTSRYAHKSQKEWARTYRFGHHACNVRFQAYLNYSLERGANPILPEEVNNWGSQCNGNGLGNYAGFAGYGGNAFGGFGNPYVGAGYSPGFLGGMVGPYFGGPGVGVGGHISIGGGVGLGMPFPGIGLHGGIGIGGGFGGGMPYPPMIGGGVGLGMPYPPMIGGGVGIQGGISIGGGIGLPPMGIGGGFYGPGMISGGMGLGAPYGGGFYGGGGFGAPYYGGGGLYGGGGFGAPYGGGGLYGGGGFGAPYGGGGLYGGGGFGSPYGGGGFGSPYGGGGFGSPYGGGDYWGNTGGWGGQNYWYQQQAAYRQAMEKQWARQEFIQELNQGNYVTDNLAKRALFEDYRQGVHGINNYQQSPHQYLGPTPYAPHNLGPQFGPF